MSIFCLVNISKILVIFLPMILGLFLYLLFRPTSIYIFEFIRVINLEDQLLHLREYIKPLENYMPLWIVYSLPTMLWAFSLTCLICIIWSKDFTNIFFLIYLLTAIAIILGSEILQLLRYLPGTFSYMDLSFNFFGIVLGLIYVFFSSRIYE